MPFDVSLLIEVLLSMLLMATLIYCALLERRLSAVRKGQEGLRETIVELNTAITSAGRSLQLLKAAANGAAETLDTRLANARSMIDELSLLTASGERIAGRFEQATTQPITKPAVKRDPNLPSGSVMDRLRAAR
jgi:hypothetical protein